MKAKDLKVNGEYLSCTSRDWQTNTYTGSGYGATRRVRVLSGPDTYRWTESGYERSTGSFRTKRGILVALLDVGSGEHVGNDVVPPTAFRGPWEQTWAMVQGNAERLSQERQEARDAHDRKARVLEALIMRVHNVTGMEGAYAIGTDRAAVYVAALERLVELAESSCE